MRINLLLGISLLLAVALPLQGAEELLTFQTPQQQALFRELTAELRCPKCQNQNIADSNAVVAVDMKQKTYQLVQQGQSKQQVIDFMKQRYGDFVHYQPPFQLSTVLLWLLPLLAVLSLGWTVFRRSKTSQSIAQEDSTEASDLSGLDAQLQAMIDEATAASRQKPKE